jgi:hypothetical protein
MGKRVAQSARTEVSGRFGALTLRRLPSWGDVRPVQVVRSGKRGRRRQVAF